MADDDKPPSRRLLVLRLGTLSTGAALAGCAPASVTDNDPNDAPGRGIRGYGGYRSHGGGRTDSDPRDSAGYGRGGWGYSSHGGGRTDSDPRDSAGRGRGWSSSRTDADPRDAPGRGRRW